MNRKSINTAGEPALEPAPGKVGYVVETKGCSTKESAVVDPAVAVERLVKFHADALGCRVMLQELSEDQYIISVMSDIEDLGSIFSTMLLCGTPESLEAPLLLARILVRKPSACRELVAKIDCIRAVGERDTIPAPPGA